MLTQEDDVDAHALRKRGWSISSIARHVGHDRKTITAYLNGTRSAGVRAPAGPDRFARLVDYCRARLVEDPHVMAEVLFDEIVALGFEQSYPTFTRQLRLRQLRPACEACALAKGRPVAVIEHRPGDEAQWDWIDLPDPPAAWGCDSNASLFGGAFAHSGRWRGQLSESKDQPHMIDPLDQIARRLGGLTRVWRFDRMATVCHPASGKLTAPCARMSTRIPSEPGCGSSPPPPPLRRRSRKRPCRTGSTMTPSGGLGERSFLLKSRTAVRILAVTDAATRWARGSIPSSSPSVCHSSWLFGSDCRRRSSIA